LLRATTEPLKHCSIIWRTNKQSQRNPLRASGGKDGIADIGKNIDKTLYKVCLYVDKRFSSQTSPVYHLAGQEQHGKILSSTDKWHGFC